MPRSPKRGGAKNAPRLLNEWSDRLEYLRKAAHRRAPGGTIRELIECLDCETENRSGLCELSQAAIAAKIRVTRPTVKKLLDEAEAMNWIERRLKDRSGRKNDLAYRVNWPRIVADAGEDMQKLFTGAQKVFTSSTAPIKEYENHDYDYDYESHEDLRFRRDWGGSDWRDADLHNPTRMLRLWEAATANDGPLPNPSESDGPGFCAVAIQAVIDRRNGKLKKSAAAAFRVAVNDRWWTNPKTPRPTTDQAFKEGEKLWQAIQRLQRDRERTSISQEIPGFAPKTPDDPDVDVERRRQQQIADAEQLRQKTKNTAAAGCGVFAGIPGRTP